MLINDISDPLLGSTLLVDKPKGWTSFDVVNKIRFALKHALGVKKIKVGHAGTLDPMATGLLIICTGKRTKTINELQGLDKTYEGTIFLGATTPSYDAETEVDQTFEIDHIDEDAIRQAADSFLGESQQKPPMYSAISKDGVRLYKLARAGKTVDVPLRTVHISRFEINGVEMPEVNFTVSCSKGTYIRSLAVDVGSKLQSGAYLSGLRRTRIGPYSLEKAYDLDDLIKAIGTLQT